MMKKEQKEFDERQQHIRENILKHGFFIAIGALLLNAFLNSIGIIWADPFQQNILTVVFIITIISIEFHFNDVYFGKDIPRIPMLFAINTCAIILAIFSIKHFIEGATFITSGMLTDQGASVIYCVMFLLNGSCGIIRYLYNRQIDKKENK
ncbi:MAG: hypothetical protein LBE76_07160 [Nitrososphaerota archaeon]|jgi:hypothetical protein|nr:hypothetical protein [Nitrososphaerota archaeon]